MGVFLLTLFLATVESEPTYSHLNLPPHGTVHKKMLYGFFGKKDSDSSLSAISIDKPAPGSTKSYSVPGDFIAAYNFRHHFSHDSIWISTGYLHVMRLRFEDLPIFEPKNLDAFLKKYPDGELQLSIEVKSLFDKYSKGRSPLTGYTEDVLGFNIMPTSESTCKCCILTKSNPQIELWDTHFRWDEKKKRLVTTADNKAHETIDSLFKEDFYLFVRKDVYYFVTQSGKLYHAPPPKQGEKSRTMKSLASNPRLPIIAIIEDADNDKVWLFTRDRFSGARTEYYFEMKETIESKTIDRSKLAKVDVEGRAKTLLEYLPLISAATKK